MRFPKEFQPEPGQQPIAAWPVERGGQPERAGEITDPFSPLFATELHAFTVDDVRPPVSDYSARNMLNSWRTSYDELGWRGKGGIHHSMSF